MFFYISFISNIMQKYYTSDNFSSINSSFLNGDAVRVSFFIRNSELIMAEECYFYLMASMRKMRMHIPLSYTLEFFQELLQTEAINKGVSNGIINLLVYRNLEENLPLPKRSVSFYFDITEIDDILNIREEYSLDIIREIFINSSLLSNIRVHCPENIYAEIYAKENDLDEIILLNANRRIARSISGNLLFLENGKIKVPKQTEGALISPLMENFVTFLHRQNIAEVEQVEMVAFESQKAQEILLISDEKGLFSVTKIRNKTFETTQFTNWVEQWRNHYNNNKHKEI